MVSTGPFVMVIFGATGDLMHRKLMPALYHLMRDGALSQDTFIVGVGRRDMDDAAFGAMMEGAVKKKLDGEFDPVVWEKIAGNLRYQQGLFEDPGLYLRLIGLLSQFDKRMNACVPRFFYLATPPVNYETILNHLKTSELAEGCGQGTVQFTRVMIEKPFGKDLATAQRLDMLLGSIFEERQIYRIDHYLGKETVQNILSFRFANGIFEPTWNREFIDHIQITLAEDVGVGTRGEFYDGVGALRDVVGNHMLEMLALVAMDQPRAFDATSVRDMKVSVLEAIECIQPKDVATSVVRGQYEGYAKEPKVDTTSTTETFVALKLMLGLKRWEGVPFYLRAGKKLGKKVTEISIHFKKPVVCYPSTPLDSTQGKGSGQVGDICLFPEEKVKRNVLAIRIEPDEGITLRLNVKKPGFGMDLTPVHMEFDYGRAFSADESPESYERLLLDIIHGDQTLFARTDGIEASWSLVTKILEGWRAEEVPLHIYTPGSWGPSEADAFIERDGRHWFLHRDKVE